MASPSPQHNRYPQIAVLLNSAHSDMVQAAESRFVILRKPFRLRALEKSIREALERAKAAAACCNSRNGAAKGCREDRGGKEITVRGTLPIGSMCVERPRRFGLRKTRAAGMKHGRTCRDLRRYSDHHGRLLGWWGTRSSLRRKPKQRNFGSDVPGNVGLSILANPGDLPILRVHCIPGRAG
jgi:hypothetical protein